MALASPVAAALATGAVGLVVFPLLGRSPLAALHAFFVAPLATRNGLAELVLKASPLMTIATGLAVGFRASVWNIGAEGQLVVGAICGGGLALYFEGAETRWVLVLMLMAGALGGMAWAAIPALLRTWGHASEILVTLMLAYVAPLLLSYLVHGPWRDPQGYNFPQSKLFDDAFLFPILVPGTRLNASVLLALAVVGLGWLVMGRSFLGYQMRVTGLAEAAARYAGFPTARAVWVGLLAGGAAAGLAGVGEVAGPIGQLTPSVSPGYGFAAIIVAFVGRLSAPGIVLASLLMSWLYLGGESAQIRLALPSAITGLFQGLLLSFLLAGDVLVSYRVRLGRVRAAHRPAAEARPAGVCQVDA